MFVQFKTKQKCFVVYQEGLTVTEDINDSSKKLGRILKDEEMTIVECCGRRARIIKPIEGWVHIYDRSFEEKWVEGLVSKKKTI